MKKLSMVTENQIYGIYCVTSLYLSGVFIGIYDLGWKIIFSLFFYFSFLGFSKFLPERNWYSSGNVPINFNLLFQKPKIYFFYFISSSPVILYLFLTWNQEFPFVGDHDFHLYQNYISALFWASFKWHVLLIIFSFILAVRFNLVRYWIPLAGMMLIWWSRYDTRPWHQMSHAFYVRYPALARFFSAPLMSLAMLMGVDALYNISRILNLFSLFAWMAFLRPYFLKREPGVSFALFSLFFLSQPNVIYYFNTNYLEPLASIFILLAVESLFVLRQNNGYVVSCLLIGLAAMVKEQAILILPWVWIAGKPWNWKGGRQWARGITVGIVSVLPFFIYYLVRTQRMSSGRSFKLIPLDQWIDSERYLTLFGRLSYHLGGYGIAVVSLMLILNVIAVFQSKDNRAALLCILGAALTQIIFFFADANSSAYLGYFRFAFFSVALIAGIVLSLDKFIKISSTHFKGGILLLFFAASYNLFLFFSWITQGDMNRNFTEHSDAPIFLPISSLIEKAESQHLLRKGNVIHVTDNTGYHIDAASIHYKKKYSFKIDKLFKCSCDQPTDAVMVPFVYFSGMNVGLRESPPRPSPFADPPQKMVASWFAANAKKDQCYKEMKDSCAAVVTKEFNGEVIGLLGVKKTHN
jgi:hypothetical protein